MSIPRSGPTGPARHASFVIMSPDASQAKYSLVSGVREEQSKPRWRPPSGKQYKPVATSPPFLVIILCAILAYIALIELVLHKGSKEVTNSKIDSRAVEVRQDDGSTSLCTEYATQTVYVTTTIYGTSGTGAVRRGWANHKRQEATSTDFVTTSDAYLSITETPTAAATAAASTYITLATSTSDAYLSLTSTCQSTTTLYETVTEQVAAYLSLTSQSTPTLPLTFTTTNTAYLSLTSTPSTTTTPPPPTTATAFLSLTTESYLSLTSGAYISLTSFAKSTSTTITEVATFSAAPTSYLYLTSSTQRKSTTTPIASLSRTTTSRMSSSAPEHVSLAITTTFVHDTASFTAYTSFQTSNTRATLIPSTPLASEDATSPSKWFVPTSASSETITVSFSTAIIIIPAGSPTDLASTVNGLTGMVYSTIVMVSTSSSIGTADAGKTSSSTSSASASSTGLTEGSVTQSELRIGKVFTKVDYFNAMYLPILLAVQLKIVWVVVFASTKMVEPFHQLAKPRGATAEDTLFADYLSTGLSLSSVKAVFQGHWVMALTTTIYVMLLFLTALAAESMSVKSLGTCGNDEVAKFNCDPAWMVDVSVIRGIEVILIWMAMMVLILVILQWKRLNGVFSDPSSIASMASLLHHPDVLADFQAIDSATSSSEVHRLLAGNQYMLGSYDNGTGQYRYGLIKTVGTVKIRDSAAHSNARYHAVSNPGNHDRPITKSIPWRGIREGTLGICLFALLGLCLGYYLDGKSDPFNNFFNSNTFGPRFILVIVATIVDYQWKRIEREVRIMYPFRILGKRMASPQKTILPSRSGTPFSALPIALWNFNFFGAAIALVAILSDILIIIIAGVPFNSGEVWLAALASFYISFGILGIMLIALVALLIWRRTNPPMPREPDTLASVWMYLCSSDMLKDFEGMEYMNEARRNKSINVAGRKYFYGMATGTDGKDRYMVDHEGSGGPVFYNG